MLGVKEDYIICGNGAAELIKELMETLTGTLGIIRPTFEEYPNRCQLQTVVTFIPQNNEYRYNIQDLMDFFGSKPVDTLYSLILITLRGIIFRWRMFVF